MDEKNGGSVDYSRLIEGYDKMVHFMGFIVFFFYEIYVSFGAD